MAKKSAEDLETCYDKLQYEKGEARNMKIPTVLSIAAVIRAAGGHSRRYQDYICRGLLRDGHQPYGANTLGVSDVMPVPLLTSYIVPD